MQFTWDHIHYLEVRPYQNEKSIRQAVFKLPRSQTISRIEYNINLQTAVADILFFLECPQSIESEVLVVWRPYQNVKSIQQAVFKLPRSQTISCIGYNVNFQTVVATILVFVECPKSIAAEVLALLRPYQNVKSIRLEVFKISRSQAISCIGYNVNLQTVVAILRPYQNVKSIRLEVFKISHSQAIVDGRTDRAIP